MKKILATLFLVVLAMAMIGCGKKTDEPDDITPDVTSVEWVSTYTELTPGSYELSAKALPDKAVQTMKYTITKSCDGVSLTGTTLLISTTAENGSKFTVKATSTYDPSFGATQEITVKNEVSEVEISTEDDLFAILEDENGLGKKYALKNDIVLTKDWPGLGVADVENEDGSVTKGTPFSGQFDGKGYEISGIHMDFSSNGFSVGFFHQIGSTGIVKNVTFKGDIIARGWSGGIAGINEGTIRDCATYLNVEVLGGSVGALVSVNRGLIENCFAAGKLTSGTPATEARSSGLVAANEGSINRSYGDKDVMQTPNYIAFTPVIDEDIVKTTVDMQKAETYTGWDTDVWFIEDGYYPLLKHEGFVQPEKPMSIVVKNEESTVNVEEVTSLQMNVEVINAKEDTKVLYTLKNAAVGVSIDENGCISFTTEVVHLSYVTVVVSIEGTEITNEYTFQIIYNPAPIEDVVNIATAADLLALATATSEEVLSKTYLLTADIVLESWYLNAIGSETMPFTGTFDGQGHTISGLKGGDGAANFGLFGFIGETGVVKNFVLKGAGRDADLYVGAASAALASENNGTIENVALYDLTLLCTGQWASGVVFRNNGTMRNVVSTVKCMINDDLTAYGTGFAVEQNGTIERCYVDSEVSSCVNFVRGTTDFDSNLYTTAQLKEAKLYAEFPQDIWTIEEGNYPTLKVSAE